MEREKDMINQLDKYEAHWETLQIIKEEFKAKELVFQIFKETSETIIKNNRDQLGEITFNKLNTKINLTKKLKS